MMGKITSITIGQTIGWGTGLAAAFCASMAMAQTTDTVTADDLPLGTPEVSDGPGMPYVAATHGDWEVRCIRAEEGQPEPCQLYQLLLDGGDTPAAEFNLFDVPDEGAVVAGAQVVTPLDTFLAQPLGLQVDDGPVLRYPFTFCQDFGCVVRIGMTAEEIDSFQRGGEATVTIVPLAAPDQTVDLTLSLSGFTAAFEELNERVVAANELARALQEEAASE